jgi:hypothetical protein
MQTLPDDELCGTWVYCGYSDGTGASFGGGGGMEDVSSMRDYGGEARWLPTYVVPLRCGVVLSLWRVLGALLESLHWTLFLR